MNIAVISTSPRKHSGSLRVARYLKNVLEHYDQSNVRLVDFETYDLPLIGQGSLDKANLTPFQKELIDTLAAADLVFFMLPEYNWTAPPQFTNMLNQLGNKEFAHLFDGKVFALAGVSSGRGGREPAIQMTTVLNKLINFLNVHSVVSPRIWESHDTGKNLTETGESTGNEAYEKNARAFVDYALNVAQRWLVTSLV